MYDTRVKEYKQGNISIMVADDRTVVRKGTRQILGEGPDFKVVGEATRGALLDRREA